jgi:hypothetical protein
MNPQFPPAPAPQKPMWMGVLLGFALHFGLLFFLQIGLVLLMGVGIVQAVYIVPAYIMAKNRGEMQIAKGLLIAAGLTFLLNATCWGLLVLGLASASFR